MAKYYAVRKGYKTGIFMTWAECQKYIKGFSSAEYKSFASKADAENFLGQKKEVAADDYRGLVAYVDGSYNNRTMEFGSGIVLLHEGKEIAMKAILGNDESLVSMRNVAGEIKGSQWAIQYALDHGYPEIQLHFDYEGIEKWALGSWKANKEGTIAYQKYYNSIKDRIKVYFVKVKAHSGDLYNDKADLLAKQACGI